MVDLLLSITGISMTAPSRSFGTDFGRFYAHPASGVPSALARSVNDFADSQRRTSPNPSVTNIIAVKDKSFLPPYYARLVAEYAIENLDALKTTVAKFGDSVAVGMLKAVPNAPHPAGPIGDEVHAAIDAFVLGVDIPELTTITAKRMFAQFVHFDSQYPIEWVRSEFTVWSYEHGYAGTGDLMGRTDEGLWLIDTKSGNQVHPEVAMQCVSLSKADVILDADGTEKPMPDIKVLGVMHVRPMSVKLHRLYRTDEAFKAFLGLKACFDWMRFDAESTIEVEPYKSERPKDEK